MTRTPLTYAAVLLSAGLLSLACLPEPPTSRVAVRSLLASSEPYGGVPLDLAPHWTVYLGWALEELDELLEADNFWEARACLRRMWWDVEAALEAYRGEEVQW